MAGHSHSQNVANRKNAVDKKKAKIFTRIAKLITIAVKQGNSNNPDLNAKLRLALKMAQNCNVPKDIITKALSTDKESGLKIEEILYEGYLDGTAILALAQTTNKNKTAPEIRYIFSKENGSIAEPNSVAFMFDKISKIECEVSEDKYDEFMEDAIEAKAKDVVENTAYFAADQLHAAQLKLEQKWNILFAELQYEPNIYSTKGDIEKIEKLLEKLEENESIQACWHNFKSEDKEI